MKSIVYLFSLVIVFFSYILLPNKKKKENILLRITLIILGLLSISILGSIIFYFLNIKASLWNFAIINMILATISMFKIIKIKKIQKYEISKQDILFIIIILVLVTLFAINSYGIPFQIKYRTSDASSHYIMAKYFMKNEGILINYDNKVSNYYGAPLFMIGAYVNEGIVFSVFENYIDEFNFYKVYICCDLFMLFLSALVMYEVVLQLAKSSKQKWGAILISILYLLSYPLNSVIMGSAYLTLNLIFVSGIVLIFKLKTQMKLRYFNILLFLVNLAIIHTYILFAIVIFVVEIIYLIIQDKKKAIVPILICIMIPTLSSAIYINNRITERIGMIINEGPIYTNYYSNILLYLPIVTYMLCQSKKNKENAIENWMFIMLLISIPILYFIKEKGIISNYYFMKFYYLLWISVITITVNGIITLLEKHHKLGIAVSIGIPTLLLLSLIFTGSAPISTSISEERPWTIAEMINRNLKFIKDEELFINKEEIEILKEVLKYAENNLEDVEVLGDFKQINWTYAILNFANTEESDGSALEKLYDTEKINAKYLLAFKNSNYMKEYSKEILKRYKYIYETNCGGILVKVDDN